MARQPLLLFLLPLALACGPTPRQPPGPDGVASPAVLRAAEPPAQPRALAPELMRQGDTVHLSWLLPDGDVHHLRHAAWDGASWSAPQTLATASDVFANWADRPSVAFVGGQRWAHWLRKLGDDTYAYGIHLLKSDDGVTWGESGLLHDDASPTEHGFVSYAADGDTLHAFWLDGRAMADGNPMQLRTTTLHPNGPAASQLLDDQVCECCDTDAAVTDGGPIVVYRDRSDDEVRDIYIVRATVDGWGKPTRVHEDGWVIQGCPVNGPAVDAQGSQVAVAWFTAADARPMVRVAFSDDGGASFAPPHTVDAQNPIGRVDLVMLTGGDAVVSWMGRSDAGTEIRRQQLGADGPRGPIHVVTTTTAGRSAGVPRMERLGDQLLFVWVQDGEPSQLRGASLTLP